MINNHPDTLSKRESDHNMNFSRKKRTRLYEGIVEQIQRLIRDKVLAPGDQLLPERQLAEKLGVSRTAVRESLTALASKGLIEITPGGGAYVKEASIDSLIEPLATIMLQEQESVHHLLEARKILEKEIVKLAAQRATSTDLFRIREAAIAMQQDVEQGFCADEADVDFHLAIAQASQNPVLYNMMSMLSGLMKEGYGPSRKQLIKENAQIWVEQNFQIYEAIKNNNSEEASDLMHQHIALAQSLLKKLE